MRGIYEIIRWLVFEVMYTTYRMYTEYGGSRIILIPVSVKWLLRIVVKKCIAAGNEYTMAAVFMYSPMQGKYAAKAAHDEQEKSFSPARFMESRLSVMGGF